MPKSKFPSLSSCRLRVAFTGLSAAILSASTGSAFAQGVPRLSVNPSAYHTLVQPGILITAAMCQRGDSFCLNHAVGNPLFSSTESYATGPLGDIYIADASHEIIVKVTPAGQPTIVAGEYGVTAAGDAPLTSPAATATFNRINSITVDHAGNVYVGSGAYGSSSAVLKLDTSGTVHRITAASATATKTPVEGALASTQLVSPISLATNAAGDVYISDGQTSTVRVLSAKTGDLNTVVGCLAPGCSKSSTPVAGEKATLFNLPSSIAVGNDGTIYLFNVDAYAETNLYLYSVTTDGIFHLLAGNANLNYNQATGPQEGPTATAGDIGIPYGQIAVDPAGDVYFAATGITFGDPDTTYSSNLVEVTKGTPASPSQVLILSTGPVSAEGGVVGEGDYINTLNPEGMPSTLTLDLPLGLALDPFGRIVMPTQNAADQNLSENLFAPGPEAIGVAYFDRNGAVVLDNPASEYGVSATQQIVTLTNSGSATLRTVNIGGTRYPYYLQPTAAEIEAYGGSGVPGFTISSEVGTCLPLYEKTGVLTLQPGESCTLAFDYTPNPTVPQAGGFTLYTNDPLGPLTVTLAAGTIVANYGFDQFLIQFGSYNGLSISSTLLTPNSRVSANGDFTISAAVSSSIYDPGNPLAIQGYGYFALADYPVVPTGRIAAAVLNNATGKLTYAPQMTLDAGGNAAFSFTGLAPGTYSLEAVYLGDGKSKASFSNVETLVVLPKS